MLDEGLLYTQPHTARHIDTVTEVTRQLPPSWHETFRQAMATMTCLFLVQVSDEADDEVGDEPLDQVSDKMHD